MQRRELCTELLSSGLRYSIKVVHGQFIEPFSAAVNLIIRAKTTFPTEFTRWLRKSTEENAKEKNIKCFFDD